MIEFLLAIAQYVIIMVILAAIGCIGAFVGIKLRKAKNAKLEKLANEIEE